MTRLSLTVIIVLLNATILAGNSSPVSSGPDIPATLVKEAKMSIRRGVDYLLSEQGENGAWKNSVAMTGLACMALDQSHLASKHENVAKAVQAGRAFILKNTSENGSIIEKGSPYVNYSTAIALSALALIDNPEDVDEMRAARRFLIDSQLDEDHEKHPTTKDNPFYGGIGYGSAGPKRPDLSNTQWALEALYLTRSLDSETRGGRPEDRKKAKLAWRNALRFLEAVQNIPEDADATWVVDTKEDPENDGGFIYKPTESKASQKYGDTETLRSYGSMTYAGLKSLIYARLKRDDYRVRAAVEWARRNYTLEENPGIGKEGWYYYLQTFGKAHAAYGEEVVVTIDGERRHWRNDLIKQLLKTQKGNGSWVNENGRWMESVPELVTSYALLAMEAAVAPCLPETDK